MKLHTKALIALAAIASILGFTAMTANATIRPSESAFGAHVAAAVSPTSQLVFDDYTSGAIVNSIEIIGVNQNGTPKDACWTTPLTVNLVPGWWWASGTKVWPFTSTNCSTGRVGGAPLVLSDAPTDPPYHCQEDILPFSDWNPGSDWHNCRLQGQTPWNGFAVSSFVWQR